MISQRLLNLLRGTSAVTGLVTAGEFVRHGFMGEVILAAVIPANWHPAIFALLGLGMGTLLLLLAQVGMTIWLPQRHVALISTTLLTISWFACSWFAADVMTTLSAWAGVSVLTFLVVSNCSCENDAAAERVDVH
ncbi:hypothetical protein [Lacticaseibacillus hulanensis]|uniref:hypothetical protein n=1 Tax=Lacticaseibacillus hulanensis TaxID=2493111 RepID=UPI000FD6C58F|nr:hypothetical protein [Lacticaseibacillus hulanensis]